MDPISKPKKSEQVTLEQAASSIIMVFAVPFDNGGRPILRYAFEVRSEDENILIAEGFFSETKRMLTEAFVDNGFKRFTLDKV